MNIRGFSPGDKIVRFEPSKPYSSGVRDRSYMDEKLFFMGIVNGNIHFLRTEERYSLPLDMIYTLPLDKWDEGWESFIIMNFKFGR